MEKYNLATFSDFIEGESEASDLIYTLADEITSAVIPKMDGTTATNKWSEVFRSEGSLYVEYNPVVTGNFSGVFKYGGLSYPVQRIVLTGDAVTYVTTLNTFKEVQQTTYSSTTKNTSAPFTGYEINLDSSISYTDPNGVSVTKKMYSDGALMAFVPNPAKPYGYDTHVLIQGYTDPDGTFVYDNSWDNFISVGILPYDELSRFLQTGYKLTVLWAWGEYSYNHDEKFIDKNEVLTPYTFSKQSYAAKPVRHEPSRVALKSTPDVPVGISSRDYFVLLEQRMDDFNYFDITYGVGLNLISPSVGNPADTYKDICDPNTVSAEGVVPTIINQIKAHIYYKNLVGGSPVYVPPVFKWELDPLGQELKSPRAHFFTGRDSTTTWVINKKRRPDFIVRYWLSINNNRIAVVLEGDPAPSISDYYRSFGYIGKITPFNQYDHAGNFGVTVGMGDLNVNMTGIVEADIKENTPEYGAWGEYTSNGMWSMSMFNTRSNVFFQAHHPAFLTQLPNYDNVGTIPPALKRLVLDDDRFQPSVWTSKYHGSPIYLVHRAEGYRGFMDGVVVVEDHNIVNGDELLVDTQILKDSSDPSKGTWTEVYKFFSVNTPVNLFNKYSPAPRMVSAAILKEIR